jgi:hypothetical protein
MRWAVLMELQCDGARDAKGTDYTSAATTAATVESATTVESRLYLSLMPLLADVQ